MVNLPNSPDSLIAFRGNPNLKRSNQPIEWTKDLIEEWVKCSQDPIYFAENYMKIIHVDRGLIPVVLYDYQKEMIVTMKENRFVAAVWCRQSGKTTAVCAFLLWFIIFHDNKEVGILANKGPTAREILGRIQLAYQHLPRWLQHGILEWNKGSFCLENNSKIIAEASSSDNVRGHTFSMVYLDEVAFIDNFQEFFSSVFPTISSGKTTKVMMTSTPNGLNHFWKIVSQGRAKENNYKIIEVPWSRVPGRDQEWKELTLKGLNNNIEQFSQEYENEFLGSSGTLIAGWKLKELFHVQPLILPENGFYQYEVSKKHRQYALVADVSRGKGLDYSAFSVVDITEMPYKQVAVYHDNMTLTTDYATIIHNVALMYNDALVLVETNDLGEEVCNILHNDHEYENIVYTETNGRNGKRVATGHSGKAADRGIRTTLPVKNKGCAILKMLIEQNQLILQDENTIDELKTFSRKNKSYEAESGNTDDLVMGLVLFAWMSDQSAFKELTDIDTLNKLREKTEEQIVNDLVPFGLVQTGLEDLDLENEISEYPLILDFY